jgi:hypothetical protein
MSFIDLVWGVRKKIESFGGSDAYKIIASCTIKHFIARARRDLFASFFIASTYQACGTKTVNMSSEELLLGQCDARPKSENVKIPWFGVQKRQHECISYHTFVIYWSTRAPYFVLCMVCPYIISVKKRKCKSRQPHIQHSPWTDCNKKLIGPFLCLNSIILCLITGLLS